MTVDKPDFKSGEYFHTVKLSHPLIKGVVVSEENKEKALEKLFRATENGSYTWSVEDINKSQIKRSSSEEIQSAYNIGRKDFELLFDVIKDMDVYSSESKFYMIGSIEGSIDYFIISSDSGKPSELKGTVTKGEWKVATSGVIHEFMTHKDAVKDITVAARMEREGTIVTEGTFSMILEDAKQEAEEQNSEWEEHQYLDYQSRVIENVFDHLDFNMEDLSYEQRERIKEAISETANLRSRR